VSAVELVFSPFNIHYQFLLITYPHDMMFF